MTRRVIGYTSSPRAERAYSGGGHGSQRQRIGAVADDRGWHALWVADDDRTTANHTTAGLSGALDELREHRRDALVVASLGYLTRSTTALASLLNRAQRHGWALVSLSPYVDTATAEGERDAESWLRLLRWQRESRSALAGESLLATSSRGGRVGRRVRTAPETIDRIVTEREHGLTLAQIAEGLTADGIRGSQGGRVWYPSSVASVLRSAER